MIFKQTAIAGAFLIEIERREDQRGFFARAWCKSELEAQGLNADFVQANLVVTRKKGTLRGLHYQIAPFEEAKLVRCARGAIFDVIVDLRSASTTYGRWSGVELKAETYRMIYVPEGCAHGYQALSDNVEVFYQVSQPYLPSAERGVRFNDPVFGIEWPIAAVMMSEKDMTWPDYIRLGSPDRETPSRGAPGGNRW